MLGSLSACSTNSKEATKESDNSVTKVSSNKETDHSVLETNSWFDKNYQAINNLIKENGVNSKGYDVKNKPYAVFDWDNTTIFNDIGEATFMYQIENLQFKMTPEELEKALKMNIPKDNFKDEWNNSDGNAVNIDKVTSDIVNDYKIIDQSYDGMNGQKKLAEIKDTEEYKDFSTKIRYLYDAIGDTFSSDISYPWVTYLFTGMTADEVQELTREAIDYSLNLPIEMVTLKSPESLKSEAGQVEVNVQRGIRTIPEMQNLYKILMENGIEVYVCSASYIDVIIPFATEEKYGYEVPTDHIYAMRLVKEKDVIQTKFDTAYNQTQGDGKTKTIKKYIAEKHNNNGPILVAGDSAGDVAMLTDFDDMELGLIFNRNKSGDIGELYKKATDKESTNPNYLLQGRDENTGKLIPEQASILFGKEKATLY
ncbi:phosphoserine phosphatase [Enterococcus silesiacus]|nr:phosphoserine phosphatase [Enterococcus silesiacus]